MTARRITTIILALAATAGPAGAQEPQQRIAAALDRARAAGLPVELLESKLAEGRAKNVPLDRIAAAIEARPDACMTAYSSTDLSKNQAAQGVTRNQRRSRPVSVSVNSVKSFVSNCLNIGSRTHA